MKKQMPKKTAKTNSKGTFKKKWLPFIVGIGTTFSVLLLLNSQYLASIFVTINHQRPENISAADNTVAQQPVDPNAPSRITINAAEAEAPIDFSQKAIDETSFQKALRNGVVHFPFTSVPGGGGNTVIFGHSSGQIWAPGDYKFIFSKLEHLKPGDKIFIDYQGIRYTYETSEIKIVLPTDIGVLEQESSNILTLITCYPVGTNAKRLIVIAKQISPNPETIFQELAEQQENQTGAQLPGETKSIWQTIKSIFN